MAVPMRHDETDPAIAVLATKLIDEIRSAIRQPDVAEIRGILNEAGIRRARAALAAAPGELAQAQAAYRLAQDAAAGAREEHDQEILDAEWELDGRFVVESNKTWLISPCTVRHMPAGDGTTPPCPTCDDTGETRKSMTADERKAWKANEARKMPGVAEAAARLRSADEQVAAARDSLTVADKRLSACKADLDGAIAELNALSLALQARTN